MTLSTGPARPPVASAAPGGALMPSAGASLRLPGQHFAAALAFLTLGAIGVVWVAPQLADGLYMSPHVAGVTHLFTLGWLTMTIFGATYQLLPVSLGAPVRWERLGHTSFAAFVPGVAVFALGVMRSSIVLHHVGIALLTIGIGLMVANVAASLPNAARRDVTWAAMASAVSFLSLTLVLGVLLVHNIHTGFLRAARVHVLAIHLHVALLGWVLVMIVGMSHRLLPMFLIAHGADSRWTRRSLLLLVPGVLVLSFGLAFSFPALAWIGFALIEGGVASFLVQAWSFFRARVRRNLDAGLKHAATALVILGLTAMVAPAVLVLGITHPRLDVVYVVLGLLGTFTLYVVGLFYKIVPFLAWIARFRNRMGREKVPTVAQLYASRVAHLDLLLYVVAIAGLVSGVALGHSLLVRGAGMVLLAAVLLFVSQMTWAKWGTPLQAPSIPIPGAKS